MKLNTARALLPLAVFFLVSACHSTQPGPASTEVPTSEAHLTPSPNLIVGRVLAVDLPRHFAIIEITSAPSATLLSPDHELLSRTRELQTTAHLRTTRQFRGRTLGAIITAGTPILGDEVIFPPQPE